MRHTPGPWSLVDLRHQQKGQIRIFSEGNGRVANVLTGGGFVRTERELDCIANARLIAAAPDLLEALTALYEETANYIKINHLGEVHHNRSMQLAQAAIAKAEGRQ